MITDYYIIITENKFETQRRRLEITCSRCHTGWDVSRRTGMPPFQEANFPQSHVRAHWVSAAIDKMLMYFLFPVKSFTTVWAMSPL